MKIFNFTVTLAFFLFSLYWPTFFYKIQIFYIVLMLRLTSRLLVWMCLTFLSEALQKNLTLQKLHI